MNRDLVPPSTPPRGASPLSSEGTRGASPTSVGVPPNALTGNDTDGLLANRATPDCPLPEGHSASKTPTDVGLAPRVPSDDNGLAPRGTTATPPSDLLSRCLSTIPDTASYRTPAPRPRPDAASRKRLAWLTVAAAVPVVTVLAVLPAKRILEKSGTMERSENRLVQAGRIDYVRAHVERKMIYATANGVVTVLPDGETRHILDRKRGMIYQVLRYTGNLKAVEGRWSELSLPDGKQYIATNDAMGTGHLGSRYNETFDVRVEELLNYGETHGLRYYYRKANDFPAETKSSSSYTLNRNTGIIEEMRYQVPIGGTDIFVSGRVSEPLNIVRERVLAGNPQFVERLTYYLCQPSGKSDVPCVKTKVYSAKFGYNREPGEEREFDPQRFLHSVKQAKPILK